MSEDAILQQRIAEVERQISLHQSNSQQKAHTPWNTLPRRGGRFPSSRARYHGVRYSPYRNRTLIVNGANLEQPAAGGQPSNASTEEAGRSSGWVTKRDRHMQLINTSVYKQKSEERSKAMAETRNHKAVQRERHDKAKLQQFLVDVANSADSGSPSSSAQRGPAHELLIHNIKFSVTAGGSKLIRAPDQQHIDSTIPRTVDLGGVAFLRSQHGNLYRAGFIKAKRSGIFMSNPLPTSKNLTGVTHRDLYGPKKLDEPCAQFSSTGSCPKGPKCRYKHDPEKVAICRDFQLTGKCQAGSDCDLSHVPTPERVPACVHFLRGNCTNEDCRYAHVRVNPGAPVCKQFAVYGYCPKGAECAEKHIHECPNYANKGVCNNKKCRLPHVDRAGQLRKSAAAQATDVENGQSSDVDSDDDYDGDSDDVDSDEFEEEMFALDATGDDELALQNDYVKF